MPSLQIDVFGGFTIFSDGTFVTVAHSPRLQSLIAYLLLHRDAPATRQQIASALWPESSEGQSRTNLRKQLLQLRQSLPAIDACLIDDGSLLHLPKDAPLKSDVQAFLRATEQRDYGRAVALYRGDLLPACFDEWIEPERERLRRLYLNALEQWATSLEEKRRYPEAIDVAQKLFKADPLDESACRRLMRLHALNGNRTEALRVYQTCTDALQHELRAEPAAETRELHEHLLQQTSIAAAPAVFQWPLVGRVAEWRQLRTAWEDALMGRPNFVLITGEAGIGKTRLAEEMTAWAQHQGIQVATARCYAAEGALAYMPVVSLLRTPAIQSHLPKLEDDSLAEVSRLLPEARQMRPHLPAPGPLAEGWQRRRLFEALAVAVQSAGSPLLLIIDDMQWGDRDTLEWLHYLLRHNPCARLLLMGTARMEEVDGSHPLSELALALKRNGHFTEIELGPLSAAETASLAAHVAGVALPSGNAASLYRETEGNPLFVVETMRAEDTAGIPSTVQAVIEQRLSRLPPASRETLQLAATIGRAFTLDIMAQASTEGEAALARNLDVLVQRDIIREHAGVELPTYDFTHGHIREVAYQSIGLAQRRLLHNRVADALQHCNPGHLDGVSAQIAMHFDRGSRPERAVHFYEQAARAARNVYANAEAIAHMKRAQVLLKAQVELGSATARTQAAPLGEALGDLLLHSTRYDDARDAFEWALTCAGEVLARARLQRKIGNILRETHRYDDALVAYQRASKMLGEPNEARAPAWWHEWIHIQLEIDLVFYWVGDIEANAALLNHLQPLLMQHGTASQRASFYQNMMYRQFRNSRGQATEDMVANSKMALDAFLEAGDDSRVPAATFSVGFVLMWHGKPKEAESFLRDALQMAERTGDASLTARCITYLGLIMRQMERVDESEHFVTQGFKVAEAAGMPEYTALAHANGAWVAWHRGHWAGVREHGRKAVEIWANFPISHASTVARWTALMPLIALGVRERDLAGAVTHAQTLLDPHLHKLPNDVTDSLTAAIAAWQTGDAKKTLQTLKHTLQLAEQHHLL